MKPIPHHAAACLVAALLCAPAAIAQDKREAAPARQQAIDELDCRTLLRLGGEERGYTLVYLHGFVSGRRAQLRLAPEALAEATDRIVDHCIDHPGDRLLAVFERFRGK
jgi:hypothetical protein